MLGTLLGTTWAPSIDTHLAVEEEGLLLHLLQRVLNLGSLQHLWAVSKLLLPGSAGHQLSGGCHPISACANLRGLDQCSCWVCRAWARADWIVIATIIPYLLASVLVAIAQPSWAYWAVAFSANLLNHIDADSIFTVSNLLITSMFPSKTQGMAGGISNTVSQTGKIVGLAVTALVANQVTNNSGYRIYDHRLGLLEGYHAVF